MSFGFRSFAAGAILVFATVPAALAEDSGGIWSNGWYVQGSAGLDWLEHADNRGGNLNFNSHADNPGYSLHAAIGRALGSGFRAEAELGYQRIGQDHLSVANGGTLGLTSGSATGSSDALSLMGNLYYDYDLGNGFKPYLGAGLGMAHVGINGLNAGGVPVADDDDNVFAYQAMAGVGYDLSHDSTIYVGYRYFGTEDPSFHAANGQSFKSEFTSHTVEVGYRLRF